VNLKPQADGTLKVELSAVDRRALNTAALLAELIYKHEQHTEVCGAANDANHCLQAILAYYPIPPASGKRADTSAAD
jgi:hypothetical protein